MSGVSILLIITYCTILCFIEIPQLLKNKAYIDLWAFGVLLALGTVLALLKSFGVRISNPSDWVAWIYAPISNILETYLE